VDSVSVKNVLRDKSESQRAIEEFMNAAGQSVPSAPELPSEEVRVLRARLIMEEALETIRDGLGIDVELRTGGTDHSEHDVKFEDLDFWPLRPPNLVEIVDGCCDLEVVTKGTLSACGVADIGPQTLVNRNNLEKFGPGGYRDPDTGKWIKPATHRPPDLAKALWEQGCSVQSLDPTGE